VGHWRSNNAYEIDVIPGDQIFPITSYVFDAELLATLAACSRCRLVIATTRAPLQLRKAGICVVRAKPAPTIPIPMVFSSLSFFNRLSPYQVMHAIWGSMAGDCLHVVSGANSLTFALEPQTGIAT